MTNYQDQYDVIEIFEENPKQLILLAVENTQYEDVVIINTISKSDTITSEFIKKYKSISSSLVLLEDNDEQVIIINNYKDTQLLVDYLNENNLDFNERIRLAKSFLSRISSYEIFNPAMQKIFITLDQLSIKNDLLFFSDYIFLENFKMSITRSDIISEVGTILRSILQIERENTSNEISTLINFIDQLEENQIEYNNYNELYNEFKIHISNIQEAKDTVLYTDFSELDIEETHPKVDLDYIRNKKKNKAEGITDNDVEIEYPNLDMSPTDISSDISFDITDDFNDEDLLDNLNLNPEFSNISFDDSSETEPKDDIPELPKLEESTIEEDAIEEDEPVEQIDTSETPLNISDSILSLVSGEKEEENLDESDTDDLDGLLNEDIFSSWMDKDFALVEENENATQSSEIDTNDQETIELDDTDPVFDDVNVNSLIEALMSQMDETTDDELSKITVSDEEVDLDQTTESDLDTVIMYNPENNEETDDMDEVQTIQEDDGVDQDDNIAEEVVLIQENDINEEVDVDQEDDINEEEVVLDQEDDINEEVILDHEDDINEEVILDHEDDINEEVILDQEDDINEEVVLDQEDDINEEDINTETTPPSLLANDLESDSEETSKFTENDYINPEETIDRILNTPSESVDVVEIKNEKAKSKKSYYVPSFLAFFFILLTVTTLLLYYSTTYL